MTFKVITALMLDYKSKCLRLVLASVFAVFDGRFSCFPHNYFTTAFWQQHVSECAKFDSEFFLFISQLLVFVSEVNVNRHFSNDT